MSMKIEELQACGDIVEVYSRSAPKPPPKWNTGCFDCEHGNAMSARNGYLSMVFENCHEDYPDYNIVLSLKDRANMEVVEQNFTIPNLALNTMRGYDRSITDTDIPSHRFFVRLMSETRWKYGERVTGPLEHVHRMVDIEEIMPNIKSGWMRGYFVEQPSFSGAYYVPGAHLRRRKSWTQEQTTKFLVVAEERHPKANLVYLRRNDASMNLERIHSDKKREEKPPRAKINWDLNTNNWHAEPNPNNPGQNIIHWNGTTFNVPIMWTGAEITAFIAGHPAGPVNVPEEPDWAAEAVEEILGEAAAEGF